MGKLLRDALLLILAFVIAGSLLDNIGVFSTVLILIVGGCLYGIWGLLINGTKRSHR